MIWTEQDAKAMWCPFTRIGDINLGGVANRPDASTNCIASGCLMWRKIETTAFKLEADAEFKKTGARFSSDTGYCGLAGKPSDC